MHMLPSVLYLPAAHASQASLSAFGLCPGKHVSHDSMTSVPSLCRCVPDKHSKQCVAPTPKATVSGSSPGGQNEQATPSALYLPGGQMTHWSLVASGAFPASHATHAVPVALAQPFATWSKTFGSSQFWHTVRSSDGCCPTEHRSHTPWIPAKPAAQLVQPVWSAFGSVPSAHDPHVIRSAVNRPVVAPASSTVSMHRSHMPSAPAVPIGQFEHPEWSAFGCVPSAHAWQSTRFAVYLPSSLVVIQASHETPAAL